MTETAGAGRCAVLVNPEAGVHDARARLTRLRAIAGERATLHTVCDEAALAEFASSARDVETVAICGGDGTLGRVVTALAAAADGAPTPRVAPLGGGTMNTIARSLGIRRLHAEERLDALLTASRLVSVHQPTLRIGDRIGFMAGAGVPARFLALYEQGQRLGAWRAVVVLARLIASTAVGGSGAQRLFAATGAQLEIDGVRQALSRTSLLYAATIAEIGLGFRPTPRAGSEAGRFQLLAGDLRAADLVRALPNIRRGTGVGGRPWLDVCAAEARIVFDEPTLYMVDGDVGAPALECRLSAGPVVEVVTGTG